MNDAISNIIKDFNELIEKFMLRLARIDSNSVIANNMSYITTLMKQTPKKLIEIFVVYILADKDKIDKGDDEYFLNKTYYQESNGEKGMLSKVFELKKIWLKIGADDKKIIIKYMQLLCRYAEEYFFLIHQT